VKCRVPARHADGALACIPPPGSRPASSGVANTCDFFSEIAIVWSKNHVKLHVIKGQTFGFVFVLF
jgi:hypothetical protein